MEPRRLDVDGDEGRDALRRRRGDDEAADSTDAEDGERFSWPGVAATQRVQSDREWLRERSTHAVAVVRHNGADRGWRSDEFGEPPFAWSPSVK